MTTQRHNINGLKLKYSNKCCFVASSCRCFVNKKGFTMVELIVVAAIIAIMSAASIVGFGYLGDVLKTKEVTGMLGDLIKQEELKILRGDFEKTTIHFLKNYIVIEEAEEGCDPKLLEFGLKCDSDPENYKINYQDAVMTQKDGEGRIKEIKNVSAGSECVVFKDSTDAEWDYQLNASGQFSKIVRFIHFNVKRDDLNNPIYISEGSDSKIELTAPYGKKIFYDKTGTLQTKIILTVTDTNGRSTEKLNLQ